MTDSGVVFIIAVVVAVGGSAGFVFVEELFWWSLRTRCCVTGRMFFCAFSCLPCPCHGEKRESVVSRWRFGGWQIKDQDAGDHEVKELRRIAGLK